MERLLTLTAFREAVKSGNGLVITDSANGSGAMFHPDPDGCSHVQDYSFEAKVVKNGERNGSYFAINDVLEARQHWPEVATCRSSACSSASGLGHR